MVVQYQDAQFAGAFGGVVVTLLDRDDRTCHEDKPRASESVRVLDPGRLGEPAQKVANARQVVTLADEPRANRDHAVEEVLPLWFPGEVRDPETRAGGFTAGQGVGSG
jgi:hypothetical protein